MGKRGLLRFIILVSYSLFAFVSFWVAIDPGVLSIPAPLYRLGALDRARRVIGLVELGGIEPPTSCMPCKRSPS